MTFTQVFGGTTIYPADVSYRAVALSADQTLAWPTETATSSNVVAQIMDVTPSVGSLSVIMPPANEVSVGETTLLFNAGSFAFTVKDNGGNTIVSISPGLSYQVYLIGNSTVNGTWRSTQYAAGTSSATAGSLVGAGIKAINTTLNQSMSVTALNSNYIIGSADRSEAFVWSGGAGTLTLPAAATVGNDWFCHVRNGGTGAISLVPAGSDQINGATTLAFNPGDSAIVICDGSNFFTIGFGQSASFAFDYVSIDLTNETSPYTLSGANLNRISYSFGGALAADMVVYIPATFQQYWLSNETSGGYSITVKVDGQTGVVIGNGVRAICYCNGTDLVDADTSSFSFPVSVAQGGTGATTEGGALINLGGTSVGRAVFTAVTAADGRTALLAAGSGANSDITSLTGLTTPLSVAQGGTGQSAYTDGQLLIGNTTGGTLTKATLTAGTNVSITNGTGSITINATDQYTGTVTSVAALTLGTTGTDLSSTVATSTTTPVITLNVPTASAVNRGALSSADWSTFNGKQASLVSGSNIKTVGGATLLGAGDVGTIGVAYGGTGQTTYTNGQLLIGNTTGNTLTKATLTAGSGVSITNGAGTITIAATGSGGTVTSVGFTGGIISVATATTTPALTVAGTSGGIPYFSGATTWASSAALAANSIVIGGGAGVAPATITTGTGVVTALGVNTGSAGAFVVNGGALGTPSSGTLTNCTFPTLNQNTTGSAATLTTARTITIGSTGKTFNGSANVTWTLSEIGAAASGANTDITALDQDVTVTATGTISASTIGYRGIPQNAQSGAYQFDLPDAGKHIYSTNSGAQTITVPTNATTPIPVSTAITVVNNGTTAITFTTTGTTVYKAGTSAAWASGGTLGVRGMATWLKVDTNTWFVSGSGLS